MAKNQILIIVAIIFVIFMVSTREVKKEGAVVKSSLSGCLDRRNTKVSYYSSSYPDNPWWVSPCYKVTSQMDSCSSWIEPGDVGDYIMGFESFGRENLNSDEEQAISCAEDYGDPNPGKGDCGGGLVWSSGWCITACVDTTWSPSTSTVCSGIIFIQTSNCGNTRSATGTKTCVVECPIYGDTPPACNGIDRTELGAVAQEWMGSPTSDLRTKLGNAAQDWINKGGI